MQNLTLIIPAKDESESLPSVLTELKKYNCKIMVILEKNDEPTINSIKNYDLQLIFQSGKGYGNALIEGINNVTTEFLCIFNADGSFNPKYLDNMSKKVNSNIDLVFASRYMGNESGSEDDTLLTKIGNYFFSLIGNIFFSLNLSDILFTYILGRSKSFKSLNLNSNDFCLCVEIPIKARRKGIQFTDMPSFERKRIAGKKKVNEFKDGFKILIYLIKIFFKKN